MNIREKILVVEDEKSISRFISTILNTNGYEAMQARSGQEALSMITSHCPDLIILDLGLPDMDGMDILRQLRSWTSLPVVVVSARSHEGDKVSALDLWGPRAGGDNQILRVNMANIRRKIEENPAEPRYLFTEIGVGYRMAEGE